MTKKSDTKTTTRKTVRDSSTGRYTHVEHEKRGYQATKVRPGPLKPPKGGTGESGTKK